MTPEEFAQAAAKALSERKTQLWERIDLDIVLRGVRQTKRVTSTDLLILKLTGRTPQYSPELPKSEPSPSHPKKAVQDKLF